jgi:hypothetical protein
MKLFSWLRVLIVLSCVIQCQGVANDDMTAQPVEKGVRVWEDFSPALESCFEVAQQRQLNDTYLLMMKYRLRDAMCSYSVSKGAVVNLSCMPWFENSEYKILLFFLLQEFNSLWPITTLNLSGCGLTNVSTSIGTLTSLVHLDLSCNALTALPCEVNKLTLLQYMYIHNNTIQSLPDEFCTSHAKLKELDISDNKLESLPNDINLLDSLIILRLSNNQVTELPGALVAVPWLRRLYVDGNQLEKSNSLVYDLLAKKQCNVYGACD